MNSNRVKTEAFREAALRYGDAAAEALVAYHVENGGVSRYKKFIYFLNNIARPSSYEAELSELLKRYSDSVKDGLIDCEITPGLDRLREATPKTRWLVVSGGDQAELREIFAARELDKLFDGGIFGSPATKDEILEREMRCGQIVGATLFFGDSVYDYSAALQAGFDFVFVSGWTELKTWQTFVQDKRIFAIDKPLDLLYLDCGSEGKA